MKKCLFYKENFLQEHLTSSTNYQYEVGFNELGIIEGLKIKLASKCGISPDLSGAINSRALLHIDNSYYLSDILVENFLCKTNTSSSTAFRGFGGNQGMMVIENIIDNIARSLNKDSSEIRRRNFYQKKKKNITHYLSLIHISAPTRPERI